MGGLLGAASAADGPRVRRSGSRARALDAGGVGFGAHCDDVLHWEPAVLSNAAHDTATIRGISLQGASAGLAIVAARAYFASPNVTDEARARTRAVGLLVAPTPAMPARAWHLVLDLHLPCNPSVPKPGEGLPVYTIGGIKIAYSLATHLRHASIQSQATICINPKRRTTC